jgi:glycosyltransferase involved in cell wall biosynthesis
MRKGRKHIAIVGVGPVGTGRLGEGIPALVQCIEMLARDFEVTVYSLLKPNAVEARSAVKLRFLPFRTPFLSLDVLILVSMIVLDACRRRIDLLHAIAAFPAGWLCVPLARILRIPCVVSLLGREVADIPEIDFGDLRDPRKRRIIARVCVKAGQLTALTRFHAAGLAAIGLRPEQAQILTLGVERSRFPFSAKALRPPYVFLHVAYAHPVKDIETLLRTFQQIVEKVDAKLVIIGERHIAGQTEDEIRRLALSSSVELMGAVSNARLHEFYSRAHFLLHTSRYESQAVVVNEAMASGVVVCATDVGLVHDLGRQFFIAAKVGDFEHLAAQVLDLLMDPAKYQALRAHAYEWAVTHDVNWTTAEHRRIYEQVMARNDVA